MTAKEIRKYQEKFPRLNGQNMENMADGSARTFALMEIAAQLAEINEKFASILRPA